MVSFTAVKKTGKKTKGLGGEEVDEQVSVITEITSDQQNLDFDLVTK
jgi:hypothetical protein